MKRNLILLIIAVVIIAGVAALVMLNISPPIDKSKYIATVNSQKISREDFVKNLDQKKKFYQWSKQNIASLTSLENDVLEKMIDEALVLQFAKKSKIEASQGEIGQKYNAALTSFGRQKKNSDEASFSAQIKEMYGLEKQDYLEQLKMDVLKEKVQSSAGKPLVEWLREQRKAAKIEYFW